MPKIAIISDVHGNLPALKVVLEKLDEMKPDSWLCLGDIVGYGPDSSECIDIIIEREIPTVIGNHDAAVAGQMSMKFFKNPNKKLLEITRNNLSDEHKLWLGNLPYTVSNENLWIASHASPINPQKWMYIDSAIKARNVLSNTDFPLVFVGHTHIPSFVSDQIGILKFLKGYKYLINPGSVGQSRDSDFRASCCVVDTDNWEIEFIRAEYNIEKVLTGLSKLGFSRSESHRLIRY